MSTQSSIFRTLDQRAVAQDPESKKFFYLDTGVEVPENSVFYTCSWCRLPATPEGELVSHGLCPQCFESFSLM